MRGRPQPRLSMMQPRTAGLQLLAVLTLLAGVVGMHSLTPCDMSPTVSAAHAATADHQSHTGAVIDASDDDCQFHQCSAIASSSPSFSAPTAASWAAPLPTPPAVSASWTLSARRLGSAPPWTTYSLEQLSILRV